ncbi:alpha/beta hydrolase, partial [Mycobacterium tuberculosis]
MSGNEVHPDLRRIAVVTPRQLVGPRTLPVMRALIVVAGLRMSRTPPDIEVLTLESGVGVRLYRPAGSNEPAPALLWIHAGGYVMGTAQQDDRLCLRFSSRLGITVASVDYRLAPENPYPAALGDCYSALTWLASLPAVDPARVAIGGASAGGGLAAALALLARDRGGITPAFQLLVYPMLDDRPSI